MVSVDGALAGAKATTAYPLSACSTVLADNSRAPFEACRQSTTTTQGSSKKAECRFRARPKIVAEIARAFCYARIVSHLRAYMP
jgi:hypothetical protein